MAKILGFLFLILFLAVLSTCSPDVTGGEPVSGYSVSNVVYSFDTTNPSVMTAIAFDLDNPAATVKVGIGDTAYNLHQCESATPFIHWTCALTGVTVTGNSSLRVVATQ